MVLKKRISDELLAALKQKESFKAGAFRLLLAAIQNREIEKRSKGGSSDLTDEEVLEVLSREAKKRKEAFQIYEKAGRKDLAEREDKELEIVKAYLPATLGEEEVKKIAIEVIEKIGAKSPADFGKAMGEAMKELKGKAEPGTVSRVIKEILGGQ